MAAATAADRHEFLGSQKILRLGTVGPDGMPHVVPVWYWYDGQDTFHIGTNTKTKKARNVMNNSRVSFCVDVGVNAPDICGVMGYGEAGLIRDERVRPIAERILERYYDTLENPAAQELLRDTDCIIEIVPQNTTMWRF